MNCRNNVTTNVCTRLARRSAVSYVIASPAPSPVSSSCRATTTVWASVENLALLARLAVRTILGLYCTVKRRWPMTLSKMLSLDAVSTQFDSCTGQVKDGLVLNFIVEYPSVKKLWSYLFHYRQ